MSFHLLLTIHIASVILLLGIGGGSAYYKFMADRSKNLELIVHTNKLVVLADWLFITPAVILQPLSGFMLMNLLGYPLKTPWLMSSILLYTFSIILWLIAVYLQIKMKELSISLHDKKRALTNEYFKLVKYWIWLGVFSSLAMSWIFILMIFNS